MVGEFISYGTLIDVHVTAVFVTLALVVVADVSVVLWMIGKLATLPAKLLHALHYLIAFGLTVIIAAGIGMFSVQVDSLLNNPAFLGKIGFVVALVINSFFIARHSDAASRMRWSEVPHAERAHMIRHGIISAAGWIGAFVLAGLIR